MGAITYRATLTRAQIRMLYIRCETASPAHKSALKWLSSACSELYADAEVEIKSSGEILAKGFEDRRDEEAVVLDLTRDAVLGIKYTMINALLSGGPNGKPATVLDRRTYLSAVAGIGPDGILKRLIEAEAKLPDNAELDEDKQLDELDKALAPKKEA